MVIEAFQMTREARECYRTWPLWLKKAKWKSFREIGSLYIYLNKLLINTMEGQLNVSIDDWIIRGVKGEIYPCKPNIFKLTYELVE